VTVSAPCLAAPSRATTQPPSVEAPPEPGSHAPAPRRAPLRAGLRVGGMAFGNGVLMRAGRHWAWARTDGSVLHGVLPARLSRLRLSRVPLLRSVAGFVEMLVLSAHLHRLNGVRRTGRLLLWLALLVAASAGLSFVIQALVHQQLLAGVVLQVFGLLLALAVLQLGMGGEVWRYHGAEHKAVNAYEGGADLDDAAAVGAFSRIHDRCGTNLVAVVVPLSLLLVPLGQGTIGQIVSPVAAVLCIAGSLELFLLLQRHPRWALSRAVLTAGRALQRAVTTRDPRPEHLELACAALVRVVELESAASR
jgi:uncharacterized protein YqhQ